MSKNKKIFSNLDLQGNQILNNKIQHVNNSDLDNFKNSSFVYDVDNDAFVAITNSLGPQQLSIGPSISKFLIESQSLGDGTILSNQNGDTVIFKEGDNITFGYDIPNKSLTINANVNYSDSNYSEIFGDSSNLTYTITHNLDTTDVIVSVLIESDASINPSFTVDKYKIIDSNSIEIYVNTAPGNNNLRAVVNSKHGQRGVQGFQGVPGPQGTGVQGVQGGIGNIQFDGAQNTKILYVNGTTISPISEFLNSSTKFELSKDLELSKKLNINGELNSGNLENITFKYNGSLSGPQDILSIKKINESLVETDLFNIDSNGQIFSQKIKNDLSSEIEDTSYFLVGDKNGNISSSNYPLGSSTIFKEVNGEISNSQILNSYSNPIQIIEGNGVKIIDIHDIFVYYKYLNSPYYWPNTTGFIFDGLNKYIGLLNNTMLQDNTSSAQKIIPVYSENSTNKYVIPGIPLVFRTLNFNPALGYGSLKYSIRYSLIDIT